MIPIITYTSHTFHHYIQWIANLEDRILTADTLLLYLWVVGKVDVKSHELKCISRHFILGVGDLYSMRWFTPHFSLFIFYRSKVTSTLYKNRNTTQDIPWSGLELDRLIIRSMTASGVFNSVSPYWVVREIIIVLRVFIPICGLLIH